MNHTIVKKNYDRNCPPSSLNHSGLGMLVVIDRHVDDIATMRTANFHQILIN